MIRKFHFPSFLLTSLGFLLLLEWIWPIEQLSGTAEIWVFFVFLFICFFLSLFKVHFLISIFVKGITMLYLLHHIYFDLPFYQIEWVTIFLFDLINNIELIFTKQWSEMSHLFRSLLFFILLWMMVYLLNYWLNYRKKVFIIYLLTFIYITVLDTFTAYDAKFAVIRMVLIGFIMLSILTYQRLHSKENITMDKALSRKWITSFSVLLIFSITIGYGLPKASSIWPDPLTYIPGFDGNVNGQSGGVKRVGYGVDDTSLGGPMIGDSTVVFQTEGQSTHYWKVETKDVYTGKGWVQSTVESEQIPFRQNNDVPITTYEGDTVEKKEQVSQVTQIMKYPHVLYPHGVKNIETEDNGYSFKLDPDIEKIYSFSGTEAVSISNYTVTYEKPSYNLNALQAINNTHTTSLSDEFMSRYTQLPESLPERVKNLAVELTDEYQGWYDKAKAIESYLKGPDFTYDLQNASIPGENEDYVDQFLFDSMVGYCNNFSTSMVVMLRSLDIPARWVKGYTEGEYIRYQDGNYQYEVTNNNAHAWVEVYFPHIGWVTFEPTKGFSNVISYYIDVKEAEETIAAIQQTQQEQQSSEEQSNSKSSSKDTGNVSMKEFLDKVKAFFSNHVGWVMILFLLFVGAGIYLYRIRVKWLPHFYIRKFKRHEEDPFFADAYVVLLKQLARYGMERKTGQTLREYANEVDRHFSTDEMSTLTMRYEQYIYGNQLEEDVWKSTKQLWENLIKRTIA